MSFVLSPNMSLSIPTVGQEPGPQYAFDVNSSLTLIDQHDHSPGRGIQITPAGININATLSMNSNDLTNINNLRFVSQVSPSSNTRSISIAPGSGTGGADLFFTDGVGNQIQITKSGIVNVVAASIPGESYAAGSFIWTQTQDSLPTTPANFDIGSVTIRPNVAATTNGVTLTPPGSIASAYNISLPLLPLANSFASIDNSGVMATIPLPLTGSNIAALTVAKTNQVAVGQQISSSSSTFSTTSLTPVAVTNLSVTITTTGRPVIVMLQADGVTNAFIQISATSAGVTALTAAGNILINRDSGAALSTQNVTNSVTMSSSIVQLVQKEIPPSSVIWLDTPGAGSHTYSIFAEVSNSSSTIKVFDTVLVAYEL